MPINKSIEDLPRSGNPEGIMPSPNNFVAEEIANHWAKLDDHVTPPLAVPEAGPYRGSMAGTRCDRQLYYALHGDEESNPPGVADRWRMGLGTTIHEMLQQIATDLFNSDETPDFANPEAEVKVDLRPIGIPGSANLDFLFEYKGRKCAVEIKSINGFGFKSTATTFNGPAEGPRFGHVLQGAMAAKALGAELLVVCYLSMENVSPQMASSYSKTEAGRFAAEWHYTVEELEPQIAFEVDRITNVLGHVERDEMPKRTLHDPKYPEGAEVNAPSNGGWVVLDEAGGIVDNGSTWFCAYCPYKNKCQDDGR